MPIKKEFLEILVCPLSRKELILDGETLVSTDSETRRRYKIQDGIPNLLVEESEELSTEEWNQIMQRREKA